MVRQFCLSQLVREYATNNLERYNYTITSPSIFLLVYEPIFTSLSKKRELSNHISLVYAKYLVCKFNKEKESIMQINVYNNTNFIRQPFYMLYDFIFN